MEHISPFQKSSGQIHKELEHIERFKKITVPKLKCKYFFGEEGCTDETCLYSHKEEDETTEKRVPKIDIAKKVHTLDFGTHFCKIPRFHQPRAGPTRIMKHILNHGTGKYYASQNSRIIFRCYGFLIDQVSFDPVVFVDHRTSFKSMRLENLSRFLGGRGRGRSRGRGRFHHHKKKNHLAIPKFYHFILSRMKKGEECFCQVHPSLFSSYDINQRFKISFPKESTPSSEKKQKAKPRRRRNYDRRRRYYYDRDDEQEEDDDDLKPQEYAYFYFVVDEIFTYDDYMTRRFHGFYPALKFVDRKMEETQERRLKIFSHENFQASHRYHTIGLSTISKEYEKLLELVLKHDVFYLRRSRRRNEESQKRAEEKKKRLVKLNLRLANTYLLKKNYYEAHKHSKHALKLDYYNFQPHYYLCIGYRKRVGVDDDERSEKNIQNAFDVLQTLESLVSEKQIEASEKQMLKMEKEFLILEKLREKVYFGGKKKKNESFKSKKLFEVENQGFYSEAVEEEMEKKEMEREGQDGRANRKVWFGPDGEEFIADEGVMKKMMYLEEEEDEGEILDVKEEEIEKVVEEEEKET